MSKKEFSKKKKELEQKQSLLSIGQPGERKRGKDDLSF